MLKKVTAIIGGLILMGVLFYAFSSEIQSRSLGRLYEVILPDDFQEVSLPWANKDLFGNPHYEYHVSESQFRTLTPLLKKAGYSEWIASGGSYGRFNQESSASDPLLLSCRDKGRWKLMIFYRPSTRTLDAVSFYN